jgi:hypothetical protein
MTERRRRALIGALVVALVVLRSFVATYYEGFYFDSDQAIVGLMARHLSRFETFPLFYYSLNYILGVQAWIIAPFFWLGRSSVTLARIPFVALNILVALWLVRRFTNRGRLAPAVAFVAALPFIMPTPAVSTQLLELAGACVEPFVYVLLLWTLRRRPFAFGLLLAVAFLHREFTIFALPAILLVEMRRPGFWSRGNVRRGAWAAAGFALAWLVVDDVKLHLIGGGLIGQATSLGGQMCVSGPELAQRVRALVSEALPILHGGYRMPLAAVRMTSAIAAGSSLVGVLVAAMLALMVARMAMVGIARLKGSRSTETQSSRATAEEREPFRRASSDDGLGAYLAWVGLFTACVYPLSCNVILHAPPLLRYLLLALLLPVGLFAVFMQRETSRALRTAAVSVFVLWGVANLWDNVRLVREAVQNPPGSEHRVLVDYLLQQRIRYARAIYWDAYVVDFLSRERVITASVDIIRIPDYQRQVDEHANAAVNLERMPCDAPRRVASWCITGP